MSSGVGSAYMAQLVVDRYGTDAVTLLFADVRREDGEDWEAEDQDNYRFLDEIVPIIGAELVTVSDGRGVWGVAEASHMIPNNRAPFCSRILKHEPCAKWLEANCWHGSTTLYVGIDITEIDRCEGIAARWAPWPVEFPLCEKPYPLKTDALDWCRSVGVEPPAMYSEGFAHANCAGACVRMGNGAAELLLRRRPDTFARLEAKENEMRAKYGNVSILVDRRGGGPRRPYPLSKLRAEIEAREASAPRLFDDMDCGRCF
jgi:hypothetical protein